MQKVNGLFTLGYALLSSSLTKRTASYDLSATRCLYGPGLCEYHAESTRQAVYQELRKLIATGCITKIEKLYLISFPWILKLNELSTQMYESSLRDAQFLLPHGAHRTKFVVSNLSQLVQLWTSAIVSLVHHGSSRTLLEYVPHAWFAFLNLATERRFQEVMKRERIQWYMIVGNNSPIDRDYVSLFHKVGREISMVESPFHHLSRDYFSVVGSSIIKIRLPQAFAYELNQTLQETRRGGSKAHAKLSALLHSPVKVPLTIEGSPKQTDRIRKQFLEYFGKLD